MAAPDPHAAEDPEAAWRRLAARAIDQDIEALRSTTAEGLTIAPLYARRIEDPQQPWRAAPSWRVAQRVDHPEAAAANRSALLDLEGGADALVLVGRESPYSRGFGAPLDDHALDEVLTQVELDMIDTRIDAGPATAALLADFAALGASRRLTSASLAVDIGFDPIGWHARLGEPITDDPRRLLDIRAKAGLGGTLFLADGRPWHEAGAGEAQELAAVLATAVAYLRQQEALGIGLDEARDNLAVLLAADADVFLGLAKFRAMRRLWVQVETASGLETAPLRLCAETSWRMMTRYDPWTNAMRATAAAFAAGLGGADTITVLPFTLTRGLPDDGARRLARNLQRVLLDEAHLAKVADPAAGAGGFEALTDTLCRDAWRLFQEIEIDGGIEAEPARGRLKQRIAETQRARASDIAHLRHGIVGTSRFASFAAPLPDVLEMDPYPSSPVASDALPCHRDAEGFDALRDRVEALADRGARPGVFLATFGPPASFGPHVSAATNFFATAGLAVAMSPDESDRGVIVAAFKASGYSVACLCGPDAKSVECAAIASALRAAGARCLLQVGGSPDVDGIDAAIRDDCDALQLLRDVVTFSTDDRF